MKIKKSYNSGFTLIELLVVISIIGLLSSVVLASLNSAREKSRLAAAMQFESSAYHKLGADAVGMWSFDDGILTGNKFTDSSGNNNRGDGTCGLNQCATNSSTYNSKGQALALSGGYITIPNSQSLNSVTNNGTSKGTISLWIKTTTGATSAIFDLKYGNANFVTLYVLNTGILQVNYPSNGAGGFSGGSAVNDNKWHHVAVVFGNVNGTTKLYLDGKLVGESTLAFPSGASYNSNKTVAIGAATTWATASSIYTGSIDNVYLFSEHFLASDIQKLYAEGLKSHILADNI